jgi:hypothetical protein
MMRTFGQFGVGSVAGMSADAAFGSLLRLDVVRSSRTAPLNSGVVTASESYRRQLSLWDLRLDCLVDLQERPDQLVWSEGQPLRERHVLDFGASEHFQESERGLYGSRQQASKRARY